MMNRREFLTGSAAAAGIAALGGCASSLRRESFYGPAIRDRLWMWGHHADMCHKSVKKGAKTIHSSPGFITALRDMVSDAAAPQVI